MSRNFMTIYFVEDTGDSEYQTYAFRSKCYAIGISKLVDLMAQAGFEDVERLDNRFFQPVIVGRSKV